MERKHFKEKKDLRYLPSLMMSLLSGYTEKPNRVIISSLVIVFGFAFAYYTLNLPVSTTDFLNPEDHISLIDSVYFSFITFTTVGYGDLIPRPISWFRLLVCMEAFSGPFMAGLYIFTLTRRYSAS
jgi:cytochrome c biogenesis protein CcdA